jgi:stearoyl-CoA desaturase (Delta-9 desaturase)
MRNAFNQNSEAGPNSKSSSSRPRGVFELNSRAKRRARRSTVATVCVPLIGFLLSVFLGWGRHVSWVEISVLIGFYCFTTLGVTLGFHRLFSHRAFQTSRVIEASLIFLGSMAAQGPVLRWVAAHRRHHTYSDRVGDPHSPIVNHSKGNSYLQGAWHAHIGWLFHHEITSSHFYAPDLYKNTLLVRMSRPAYYVGSVIAGLVVPAVICGGLSTTWAGALRGLVWGGLVRIFLVHHITWSINSICHLFGARPFNTRDHSGNVAWLALLTFGEAWHNNHHALPSSAYHGFGWQQIDFTGYIIFALDKIGAVWNVRTPGVF